MEKDFWQERRVVVKREVQSSLAISTQSLSFTQEPAFSQRDGSSSSLKWPAGVEGGLAEVQVGSNGCEEVLAKQQAEGGGVDHAGVEEHLGTSNGGRKSPPSV